MEQKVYIKVDAGFHSAMHAKNVEHVHAGMRSPVYVSRWSREATECMEATITFDESKVAGWLDLSPEHQYDFSHEVTLPDMKDGKMAYDSYHSRIAISKVSVGRDIQRAFERAVVARMDIDPILEDILARGAMLESPEAKEIIANAEAARAKQRAQDEADRLRKEEADRMRQEAYVREQAEKTAAKKAWIEANGSERLQKGFARDHNCEKLYTLELCDSLPEPFALDYEGDVSTKARSCPSLAALKLCEELEELNLPFVSNISIVWLPEGLNELTPEEPDYDEKPGCEAIELKVNGHFAYHLVD